MRAAAVFLSLLSTISPVIGATRNQSAPAARIALAGFTGNAATLASRVVVERLTNDIRISMIEPSLAGAAIKGMRYDGSINLSLEDARRLGAAIGCDFFIVGRAELVPRSGAAERQFVEALIGIFIVDARRGSLVRFDFISLRAADDESAIQQATADLERRVPGYVEDLMRWTTGVKQTGMEDGDAESVEDIPEPNSPREEGFDPPVFTNRVRPVYTEEADRADISATVEARVVLQSNGAIGKVRIVKWAGYGLDEAAVQAIRQLKFTPATRDGKQIGVRALIRYNFRRTRVADPIPAEPEKKAQPPERDLRQIFKPKWRPPGAPE